MPPSKKNDKHDLEVVGGARVGAPPTLPRAREQVLGGIPARPLFGGERRADFVARQHERASILQNICSWIYRRELARKPLRAAFREFSRRWDGRPYRTDPRARLRLSATRLRHLYYEWRAAGQRPSTFLDLSPLKIRGMTRPFALALLRAAERRDIPNLKSAYDAVLRRRTKGGRFSPARPAPTFSTVARFFPPQHVKELRRLDAEADAALQKRARVVLRLRLAIAEFFAVPERAPDFEI